MIHHCSDCSKTVTNPDKLTKCDHCDKKLCANCEVCLGSYLLCSNCADKFQAPLASEQGVKDEDRRLD